jgi:hypothetical protein
MMLVYSGRAFVRIESDFRCMGILTFSDSEDIWFGSSLMPNLPTESEIQSDAVLKKAPFYTPCIARVLNGTFTMLKQHR